jgi:hypothetical protein
MTDTDIRYALLRATEDLSVPADLLDRVHAGGRHRVVRRRAVLAGGLAVAATAVAAPLTLRARHDGSAQPTADRLTRPARGDLAGDAEFLGRARAAWREAVDGRGDGLGAAHVCWAGSTTVSSVALLAQRTSHADLPGQIGVTGFVEAVGDRVRVVSMDPLIPGEDAAPVMLAGPDRRRLVLIDDGPALELATDYTIDGRGRIVRRFQRVPYRDGGAVVDLGMPQPAGRIRIALRTTGGRPVGLAGGAEADDITEVAGGMENRLPRRLERRLPGREPVWPADAALRQSELDRWNVATMPAYDDPYGYHGWTGPSDWFILGATPDRRRFVLQTVALDGDARVFCSVGDPDPHYLGLLSGGFTTDVPDPDTGTLQALHVRLPQRQGVVAGALNATLRYRVKDSGWIPVSGDTALLPAAATDLEVRPRRGRPVTVALP